MSLFRDNVIDGFGGSIEVSKHYLVLGFLDLQLVDLDDTNLRTTLRAANNVS